MKIPVLLLALLEQVLNTYLRLDGEAFLKATSLQGRVIALHIKLLDWRLFFLPGQADIQVLGEYAGEPDATISGSIASLIRLSQADDSASAMLESDVEILGNMSVAQGFSKLLSEASIDWEEILSQWIGDIAAYQVGSRVRQGYDWLDESQGAMKANLAEYLSEESRLVAAEAEIATYIEDVDHLRMDTDRLAARLDAFVARQAREA